MKRINYAIILALGVTGLMIGVGLTQVLVLNGLAPLLNTPLLGVALGAIAVYLYVQGRRVLKFKRRQYTEMTATGAFKVAALTHSAAYTAAFCTGFMVAEVILGIARWDAPTMRAGAIASIFGMVGAIPLLIVALIVERWCLIDTDDTDDDGNPISTQPQRLS